MENDLLGIGAVASRSGLPVSALRFYDGVGVLRPAAVDPSSGYRSYHPDQVVTARLVAHLRRVGLPLSEIRSVVTDPATAGPVLAGHLARLEAGLADARREISIVHRLLETTEIPMTHCTLPADALTAALAEVRYAVCTDPDHPRLHGVYLDSQPGGLRVVATDRHRLATTVVPTADDVDLHLLLPTAAVDALLAARPGGTLDVVVADGSVAVTGRGVEVRAEIDDVDFPSYRVLLEAGRREVRVDAAALRTDLETGATTTLTRADDEPYAVSVLAIGEHGVRVGSGPEDADGGDLVVAVDRAFLLEALAGRDEAVLGFDEPIAPLAIRDPGREDAVSVLMPVRLDRTA